MFDIGFAELVVVLTLGLIILGPERLPKTVYTIGRWIGRIKAMFTNMQHEVEREVKAKELAEKMKDPYYRFDQQDWDEKIYPTESEQDRSTNREKSEANSQPSSSNKPD